MGRIPDPIIDDIRDRADIVGVIGRHVELKQAGRNWKGLCPFHEEKTPSFNVNADRQAFHCFGCGVGGNVFSFLMKHDGLTFVEAVHSLAREVGVEIPEDARGGERREGHAIFEALELAQSHFREQLRSPEAAPAREYLERRGIDAETIDHFGIGFAPDRWDSLVAALRRAGIDSAASVASGLIVESQRSGGHYDRLRGRITFPIQDVRGRVIAFGGRALAADQEPKYLNTPESPVYHKRRAFYGFPHALESIRRAGRAIVCEGYFDAIALARAGMGEGLATCGTALTPDHARDLRRRTEQVLLLFDGDAAGQKAMERALEVLLPAGLRVRALTLPDGQDPDDFLSSHGAEHLRARVEAAQDAIELLIRAAMAAGCTTPTEKSDAVRRVAPIVAAVPNPVERSEYARRLAVATGTDAAAVEAVVRSANRGEGIGAAAEERLAPAVPRRDSAEDRHMRQLALIVARHPHSVGPELVEQIANVLPEGPWKALSLALLAGRDEGLLAADDSIDVDALLPRLDADLAGRLSEITVDDALLETDTPVAEILEHLVERYQAKSLDETQKELTRRIQDPNADQMALLREKQALLERKRAKAGHGMGNAAVS